MTKKSVTVALISFNWRIRAAAGMYFNAQLWILELHSPYTPLALIEGVSSGGTVWNIFPQLQDRRSFSRAAFNKLKFVLAGKLL